jgi:hypothetical protein
MSRPIRPSPGTAVHDSHDPAAASQAGRKQNQLICAALLGWRKTKSARTESAFGVHLAAHDQRIRSLSVMTIASTS